jgi:hypothetical protein
VLGLIENMSGELFGSRRSSREQAQHSCLAVNLAPVVRSGDKGAPVAVCRPDTEQAAAAAVAQHRGNRQRPERAAPCEPRTPISSVSD